MHLLTHKCRLDAISMTMFMHNLSASKGKIPALLHQMSNSPTGNFWTILLETFASLFPYLLYLPSPIKTYANTLRTEFGKIAQDVWAGKDGGGMHAKVLDALGRFSFFFFYPNRYFPEQRKSKVTKILLAKMKPLRRFVINFLGYLYVHIYIVR